jgi:hypothetical protein
MKLIKNKCYCSDYVPVDKKIENDIVVDFSIDKV